MKHIYRYNFQMIVVAFIYIFLTSCKKLVEIDPPATSLTTLSAFNDDYAATAVMTGHYASLSSGDISIYGFAGYFKFTGLSSDELTLWSNYTYPGYSDYYNNNLYALAGGSAGSECWPYFQIYECNTVIENVNISKGLNTSVKNQLLGEAKFMRACYFFYLLNLYGDIPMPLSTDIKINTQLNRTSKDKVYQQIIADLKEAEVLLSSDYLDGGLRKYTATVQRVRPTKWAAMALLARTYLYTKDYANAEIVASNLITNNSLFNLSPLNDVFKANSKEAIWQLQTVNAGMNTGDGDFFVLNSTGPDDTRPLYLSETLLNAFEPGDARKTIGNWINSVTVLGTTYYFPFKYKLGIGSTPGQEYIMMFRLGEQYLIRAEARAMLGNVSGARDDLFSIRRRAGLADGTLIANDQSSLMTAVMHERQVELFTEWGHRWFDLKRTGMVDAVMNVEAPKKGGTWQTTDQLYPLPYDDLQKDKNLTQNPGY